MHDEHQVPIWFFIGGLLLIYGVLILGAGLYALAVPPPLDRSVFLFSLHADVWWGALMVLLGLFHCLRYNPFREPQPGDAAQDRRGAHRSST